MTGGLGDPCAECRHRRDAHVLGPYRSDCHARACACREYRETTPCFCGGRDAACPICGGAGRVCATCGDGAGSCRCE